MIAELVSVTALIGSGWMAYQRFVASKLDAHVEAYGDGAVLVVTNNRSHTAYLKQITALSPAGAELSAYDPVHLMIVGGNAWDPPPTREADKVAALDVDMEVPPEATIRYPFRFFCDSRARNCRIALVAWESSLIAQTKVIVCTITPKATTIVQSSVT